MILHIRSGELYEVKADHNGVYVTPLCKDETGQLLPAGLCLLMPEDRCLWDGQVWEVGLLNYIDRIYLVELEMRKLRKLSH